MRIELKNLGKRFQHRVALHGINVTIEPGARVALVGPNGSGKSTLLRAMLGLVACDGELLVDGKPLAMERARREARLAYVPQTAPAIAATVRELTSAVARVRGVGFDVIAERAARLDLDLAAVARSSFRELSGGMKQRVLIALALAAPVELLLMDEPTASLDAAARLRFFELCGEIAGDTTVLLCSHRLDEIRSLTDRVLALRDGACVYHGPAEGYVADHDIIATELRFGAPRAVRELREVRCG
jgi:ABC-type multidrug transport system ATPase subunit